ncbi:MAG: exodeoxyribonuclease VII large subunit [Deltaproteobacteria bacterium HGW-Deltaproteobacteria-17]|nr:MAG: exodeoxyribonuclease VII large subunit [Deltaproteobacteria bacterium HGW-Deltaproteobacteria-17]
MSRKKTTENSPSAKGLQLELVVPGWSESEGASSQAAPPVRDEAREPATPGRVPMAPTPEETRDQAPQPRDQVPPVFTVTDLIADVNVRLRNRYGSVWVEGELGRINEKNGIYYFVLKDARSNIDCVLFARAAPPPFELKEGTQVLVRGYLEIFAARGKFTLYVEMIEPRGEGALLLAFLQLKKKLEAEKLFEKPRRRLPAVPRTVGIVTSESGAALQDMIKIARRRVGCRILISNALVQGTAAPASIVTALHLLERRHDVDVIILARGGGSLEDLACFNDEDVVRAVHACSVPIVTAIGHQTDTTLVDFVSDLRAATPTEAAEQVFADPSLLGKRLETLLSRCQRAVSSRVDRSFRRLADLHLPEPRMLINRRSMELADVQLRIERAVTGRQDRARVRLEAASRRLSTFLPQRRLSDRLNQLQKLAARLDAAVLSRQRERYDALNLRRARLGALSPLAVLERGYAVVSDAGGGIVHDVNQVQPGDGIRVRLGRGRIDATVDTVSPPEGAPG